mgnify:CR=1 FL=1
MTAVIYARYSSDNQREESIEGQIREWSLKTPPSASWASKRAKTR